MQELISVIVPMYKVEKYLNECIDSIINQTYKNLEIILIDDGSPDNCGQICEKYAEKDSRIKVIHKPNGGLSDARNVGIENANGTHLAFVDSDDCIAENFIECLYELCQEYHSDIAECEYLKFHNKISTDYNFEKSKNQALENQEMIAKMHAENIEERINATVIWNKLYKKHLFDTIRFPKGKIHEDEFITYKLYWCTNHKIAVTDKKLYYYRQNSESIMGQKFNIKRLDYIQALEERLEFFKDKEVEKLYNKILNYYAYQLIEHYFLTKKHVPHSQKEQEEIWRKFKGIYKEISKMEMTQKEKIKYCLFRYFPNLLGILKKMKLKKRIKNMLGRIKYKVKKHICTKQYRKYKQFCEKNKQKEYLIFNTPKHGNIGDHAIIYAINKIFEKKKIKIFEVSTYEEEFYFDSIKKYISKEAIIGITGGGFIGSQWLGEQNLVNKVVNEFYNHKIIIFPQTIYFKEDEQGKEELKKSIEIFSKAENLIIFAREEKSYNFAKETYKNAKVILVPDIVLSLENMQFSCKRENILCVMRKDPEGIFSEEDKSKIYDILQKYDLPIKQTDTVVERSIPVANRTRELESKLKQFASAKLVVTDRLHGMIFASITNTPCIVLSNYNYKVEGVYQWIKDVDKNIIFERELQDVEKDVERLMNVEIDENRKYEYNFDKLYEVLEED